MSLLPRRARSALRTFLSSEAAGGIVLIAAALVALVAANTAATAGAYDALLHLETGPVLSPELGPMTVHLWINDGLMALFFLLVGLEIKRELVDGRLASPDDRRLPFVAASAGMVVPALVFLAVAGSARALQPGWAIPAATDIAFAIGVLALLGKRVPPQLKLLLATIAIVDDMGAVAIIAVAYTEQIHVVALAIAALLLAGLYVLNRRSVMRLWPYLLGFAALWLAILVSGIHATIAGVATAALIPLKPSPGAPEHHDSPLHRLEHGLAPWVAFVIVPLFGFANAGVSLAGVSFATLAEPLVLGIALGLFLGKQAGIFASLWAADRLGIARRPHGVSWRQLYGMALVAGIGFTMSLFIGGLAFADPALLDRVKIGVLAGSLLSGITGLAILARAGRRMA
ncbi:Na+/H+ antiporter NhaA [Sphingomonas sp. MA1305]|uniref:Na+/H+ antiporter NhaA n=1 Tax=Sphingomonas sp. MA1305 TaxID=2479204 RepID=UPI0018DEFFE1|nr:Na+/H+ antiporter NhaA [Sphingomonas sp. MA1305]MBI0475641.1 Na+/H+ antiporter NhaA [Sphingomonas sp. MA1305]